MIQQYTRSVNAFATIAHTFDERFGHLRSVSAQRNAVRRELLKRFPHGSRLLEIGGGTGEDAVFMARHGRSVVMTDGSEEMVSVAARKVHASGCEERVETFPLLIENLESLSLTGDADGRFDGAYSNFAALNCVEDLSSVGHALARVLRPGGYALLVFFGPWSIGEVALQLSRAQVRTAFRRLRRRAPTVATLNGQQFNVWYPTPRTITRSFHPYFRLRGKIGIGITVPPSAAEPAISRYPRTVVAMEFLDRILGKPFAVLGDHVLLMFERTSASTKAMDHTGQCKAEARALT